MNVSAPFILRPVATTLLMVGLSAIGLIAYALLPIAGVPQVDVPTIQVRAHLPGASAETMATSVATPLERQLARGSAISARSSSMSISSRDITLTRPFSS
jgi:multidrug efflux pump